MINISNELKKNCDSDKITYREYIILSGTNTQIDIKGELYQTAYKDTHFIGTFNINYVKFTTQNDIDYKKKEFTYYKEVNGKSIKIGSFIVTEIVDNDSNEEVSVTAYDYGLKFANSYVSDLDYESGTITLSQVLQECCEKCGVQLENNEITNGDFIVENNQFLNQETFGDVISAIAFVSSNFATINNESKLEFIFTKSQNKDISFNNNTIEIIDGVNNKINSLKIYGKCEQDKIPTIENPSEIKSVGKSGNIIINSVSLNENSSTTIKLAENELCSIGDIKDELNGNILTKRIGKLTLDGNENWRWPTTGTNCTFFQLENSSLDDTKKFQNFNQYSINQVLCDKFTSIKGEDTNMKLNEGIGGKNNLLRISVPNSIATDMDTFKSYLNIVKPIVYYVLETPYEIELEEYSMPKVYSDKTIITLDEKVNTTIDINYDFGEIIEDYTNLNDKRDTQPITCLSIGTSQVQEQNAIIKDEELIKKYGEHWLIINDVPFLYTLEKREQVKEAIFNKIKGFGYSSFKSEYSFKPYMQLGDLVKFRNKDGQLINSIILRLGSNYDNITLEAPSIIDSTIEYINPKSAYDIAKRAEVIADQNAIQITAITTKTETIEENLRENYYDKTNVNELVQTSETGVTNTFSEAGGNNIFRNTGLWFEAEASGTYLLYPSNNIYPSENIFIKTSPTYEFWYGNLVKKFNDKAANNVSMLLVKDTLYQEQEVANGNYTVSFKYKKLLELAMVKVIINDIEYELTETSDTEFVTGLKNNNGDYITQPLEVKSRYINVSFFSDTDEACEIYDLMVNAGAVKLAYSQNQNETQTDTVNISKGITITSTNTDTTFKANADGIRTLDKQGNIKTKFTDVGTETNNLKVSEEATICNVLIKQVENQTWFTKI